MPRISFPYEFWHYRGLLCLFLIFLGLSGIRGTAKTPSPDSTETLRYDRNYKIQPARFNQNKIREYKQDKAFDYSRKPDAENWWTRFKNWLAYLWHSFLEKLFGGVSAGSWLLPTLQVLAYLVGAGIIFLIIWLFLRLNPGKSFLKPRATPEVLLSEEEEIMREQDIPQLIESALEKKNYRLAVRYSYLLILKMLKERELIDYSDEKTNREYQSEIKNTLLKRHFQTLTRLYDFVWYGNFPMTASQYRKAKVHFKEMQHQLKEMGDE